LMRTLRGQQGPALMIPPATPDLQMARRTAFLQEPAGLNKSDLTGIAGLDVGFEAMKLHGMTSASQAFNAVNPSAIRCSSGHEEEGVHPDGHSSPLPPDSHNRCWQALEPLRVP
jgi:hypothetical protein